MTLAPSDDSVDWDKEPDSIFQIAKDNGMSTIILVEDSMGGFVEAYNQSREEKVKLIFGFRVSCTNSEELDPTTFHKNIIFLKKSEGYKTLVKLHTLAACDNNQTGEPVLKYDDIREYWNDDLLKLVVPFYDSYIHKNLLTFGAAIPDFSFTKEEPLHLLEDNGLPFDYLIQNKVRSLNVPSENAQSIFYKTRKDFIAWQTSKCMHNRGQGRTPTLEKPELEDCSSMNFNFEHYLQRRGTSQI